MSKIRKTVLKNGINVITEEMADVESATVGVWVKTGSRNERRDVSGISHFIEHLLFKGTSKRSPLDIAKEIESVGGVLNAFTGREYTCFYCKVLAKDLPRAIDLLSDIFMNSVFDPLEMDRERKVVLQEIKMVDDTPDDLVHDLFTEKFWAEHPLGRPVLGTRRSVKSIKRASVKRYMATHYQPRSVFIVAAGKLKHGKVASAFDATLGTIKKGKPISKATTPKNSSGIKLVKRDLEQVHLCFGVPAPAQTDSERYKVYLLGNILGGGMSSRLFQEIREKRGLAYSVYSYLDLCKDAGAFVVYAGTSAESFHTVVELILKEFNDVRGGVKSEELQHAKDQLKGSMILGLETSSNRMMRMARDEIYFGRVVPIKEVVKGIDSVSEDDIKKIATKLLDSAAATLVAIGKVRRVGLARMLAR
ncbi:MAG: pitrilysin family protein [Thermodesulfobacteriota bacterium]